MAHTTDRPPGAWVNRTLVIIGMLQTMLFAALLIYFSGRLNVLPSDVLAEVGKANSHLAGNEMLMRQVTLMLTKLEHDMEVGINDRWRRHEAAQYWRLFYAANPDLVKVPFPLKAMPVKEIGLGDLEPAGIDDETNPP